MSVEGKSFIQLKRSTDWLHVLEELVGGINAVRSKSVNSSLLEILVILKIETSPIQPHCEIRTSGLMDSC